MGREFLDTAVRFNVRQIGQYDNAALKTAGTLFGQGEPVLRVRHPGKINVRKRFILDRHGAAGHREVVDFDERIGNMASIAADGNAGVVPRLIGHVRKLHRARARESRRRRVIGVKSWQIVRPGDDKSKQKRISAKESCKFHFWFSFYYS